MKIFTNNRKNQKFIIVLIMIVILNFSIPNYSQAWGFGDIAGDLLKELIQLIASLGDIVMGGLNHFMLGTDKTLTSSMLDQEDSNFTNQDSWLYYDGSDKNEVKIDSKDLDAFIFSDWKIPNFLYCPENIFSNKIALLDVNFINPNTYKAVENSSGASKLAQSAAGSKFKIRDTIASWYKAFRNIAIVGLMTVLVYLGIRIVLSSTAADKAKYKESIQDWLVALCLVFIIHFIMSGILMITSKFTEMLDATANTKIHVNVVNGGTNGDLKFTTNLVGYVRFKAQNSDAGDCATYTIMYLALVLYTVMFTFTYFKRFLYMAFFTMIAPLVALTYPIDKVKDGKAQAFDMWFKEYTMNAIIQPVHLILYSVFVGSAIDLATRNPLYAVVALAFLTSAEKFVKKMFGLDKASTPAGLAAMAGGALAMKGVGNVVGKLAGSGKGGSGGRSAGSSGEDSLASRGKTIKMDQWAALSEGLDGNPNGPTTGNVASPRRNGEQANTNRRGNGDNQQNGNVPGDGRLPGDEVLPDVDGLQNGDQDNQIYDGNDSENSRGMSAGGTELAENPELSDGQAQNSDADRERDMEQERDIWRQMAADPNETAHNRSDADFEAYRLDRQLADMRSQQNQNRNNDILSAGTIPPSRLDRFGHGVKSVGKAAWNAPVSRGVRSVASGQIRRIKNMATTDNYKKVAKKVGHGVLRAGAAATAAATVGTIAAAAAVVSGDKAGSVLATGATMVGAAAQGLGNKVVKKSDEVGAQMAEDYNIGRYTKEERDKQKQAKFDKEWKRKEDNYKYLMKKANLSSGEAKKYLNDETTQKYLDHGVTDVGIIYNARKMAQDKGWSDDQALARAQIAQERGKTLVNNDAAVNSLTDRIMSKNSAIDEKMAKKLANQIAEIANV